MDSCDYCGRPMPSMTHADAPWKAFCSDECFRAYQDVQKNRSVIHSVHADFSEGILTIQSDPPIAFDFLQPPKHQPVSQMDLF